MCEVMPTISEDTALSQRGSQSGGSDPDSHFEQLMVNMLDERDRLLDTLRETQESLGLAQQHLQDVIYDRDALQRQLSSALPQVRPSPPRPFRRYAFRASLFEAEIINLIPALNFISISFQIFQLRI
ncbi:hypothetical protein AGOR_G00246530 [Albula goreensis]|uniref:Uncharacterized protein n=1 Tax=Albula goreensis TaxID=1534307 RepID=A0A8T3CAT0_9TELE|nr:hypothetical protein AGOR_G00246530 [Albula goreensis]